MDKDGHKTSEGSRIRGAIQKGQTGDKALDLIRLQHLSKRIPKRAALLLRGAIMNNHQTL